MPDLARTFVSFSSTDIDRYYLMCAWKAHEHIDFNFEDFQLEEAINSSNPSYIRSRCAAKIRRTDTFVLLIGTDTYTKTQFVQPEVEAIEPFGTGRSVIAHGSFVVLGDSCAAICCAFSMVPPLRGRR